MRGRRFALGRVGVGRRLIPAGAGQTRTHHQWTTAGRAHPRRCGADGRVSNRFDRKAGSSPQVRGRLGASPGGRGGRGLIPAGAGQTQPGLSELQIHGAHPRRCGADAGPRPGLSGRRGSSPQVRGRPLATSNVALAEGPLETTPLSHPECTPRVRGVVKPPFYYGSSLLRKV